MQKILIADDDFTSRKMLEALLSRMGFQVIETKNGLEALAAFETGDSPDLAILDWMMPKMSGLEVIGKIRSLGKEPEPYIILLTSKHEKDDVVKGLDSGADDFLSKPFDLEELKARINAGRRIVELNRDLKTKLEELRKAQEEIKVLRGIIPICSYCKRILSDNASWEQMEVYISNHSEAQFSHGICPDCMEKYFPELTDRLSDE